MTLRAGAWADGRADCAAQADLARAAKRWPTDAQLLHDLAVTARDAARCCRRRQDAGGPCADRRGDARRDPGRARPRAEPSAAARNGAWAQLLAADLPGRRGSDAVKDFEQRDGYRLRTTSVHWANPRQRAPRRRSTPPARRRPGHHRVRSTWTRGRWTPPNCGSASFSSRRSVAADAAPWFERAGGVAAYDLVEARLNLGIGAARSRAVRTRASEAYRAVPRRARPSPARERRHHEIARRAR